MNDLKSKNKKFDILRLRKPIKAFEVGTKIYILWRLNQMTTSNAFIGFLSLRMSNFLFLLFRSFI